MPQKDIDKSQPPCYSRSSNGGTGAATASPQNGNGPGVFEGGILSRNRTIALILAISAILSQSNAASFQGVGGLLDNGGPSVFRSESYGVSGDGSVVFGSSTSAGGGEAFRWTAQTGIQGLGDIAGGQFRSLAKDASYDGSTIVGYGTTLNAYGETVEHPFVWTEEGMQELDQPYWTQKSSNPLSISSDGTVAAGVITTMFTQWGSFQRRSILWDLEDGTTTLMDWPANVGSDFRIHRVDISGNGSSILVAGGSGNGMIWTAEAGYRATCAGSAVALSGDGETIAGYGGFSQPYYGSAYVWTEDAGKTRIGTYEDEYRNFPYDLSYDGSVVVGGLFDDYAMEEEDVYIAYIWTEEDGVRLVKDMLVDQYGLDLVGWNLAIATGISDDGMTIVGSGYNPDGVEEGWIATIPEPATIILLVLGGVILRRTRYV